jgi:type II secretory pathway pseudopilin PulG
MRSSRRHSAGLTILELVIVIAIIGLMSYLAVGAIRWLRGANAIDASVELTGVMRRTTQLASASGQMYRIVFDLDAQTYRVEVCEGGPAAISKDPEQKFEATDPEAKQRAIEDAKQKIASMPQNVMPATSTEDGAEAMALALTGQLAARRTCTVSPDFTGDPSGKPGVRAIDPNRTAKIKSVWVQHLRDPVTSGMVAIHFFPLGSAEKAIVEIGDGSKTFSVVVWGLTGRVELQDGAIPDPDDFLYRDAEGEEAEER